MNRLAVEMTGVIKRFGAVEACAGASLRAAAGEIHALVGENGAGKSTLMKILYGLYRPDGGIIKVDNAPVRFGGPGDAIARGIGMVHQHFMLAPNLTAAENVVLGMEPGGFFSLDDGKALRLTEEISKLYGLEIDGNAPVETLSVGEQQRLEILKVLSRGAGILILDEPTAVLTPRETASFFEILVKLKAQGKTVILITHKLREVMAVSDEVTVMRGGKTIGSSRTASTNESELARMMVGRPVVFSVKRAVKTPQELDAAPVALVLKEISAKSDRGTRALQQFSLTVRRGEIFGIAGVEGNGQTELAEVITGLRKPVSGEMSALGREIDFENCGAAFMSALGISHIPQDRHRRAVVLDYSVRDNCALGLHRQPRFNLPFSLNFGEMESFAKALIEKYGIRPADTGARMRALSGGNQQKAVVARELARGPGLLVAAQPTRGVDVGAIEFIHEKIIAARDAGCAVLLISAELGEILALSDRIGVICRGQLAGTLYAGGADEEKLGLLMAGWKFQ
ncbi:MAG: ABC transporter ATP-binding protein [Elusimicrobiales bacterium]